MVNGPERVLRNFKEKSGEVTGDFHIMPAGYAGTAVKKELKGGEELMGKKKHTADILLLILVLLILCCFIILDY